jgi:pimeloyl-ACP methyl ester carboxylesterase
MAYTQGTGPRIYFEMQEVPGGEPLALIEGMGAQMIGWRQGFIDQLKGQGFSVIRMDNRDVGLSEKLGNWRQTKACYSIRDMAEDVCRVLDSLGLESAHIVGQSMGGIMAQAMAIQWPVRVRSLTLFYTAPAFDAALVQPDFLKQLRAGLPRLPFRIPRWLLVRMFMQGQLDCAGAAYPPDQAWLREQLAQSYDRGFALHGVARQLATVTGGFDFRPMLDRITAPTAIIHGRADHAIQTEAAFQLAAGIPDAALHVFPGMAHAIAEALWPDFTRIISANARRSENRKISSLLT